jgi:hypothetical protein
MAEQEQRHWYQWYFHTERIAGLRKCRAIAQLLALVVAKLEIH